MGKIVHHDKSIVITYNANLQLILCRRETGAPVSVLWTVSARHGSVARFNKGLVCTAKSVISCPG